MTLENLNSAEFQQVSDDDAREVLGGQAALPPATYDGICLYNGQPVKDYVDDPIIIIIIAD